MELVRRTVREVGAAARSWAAVLHRVFEVEPLLCEMCGDKMRPVATILEDCELCRILANLGLPTAFPITQPARAPPLPLGSPDCQVDADLDAWLDRGESHPDDPLSPA